MRALAGRVLAEVEANAFLPAQRRLGQVVEEHALPKRDRRFLSELVLGTLRRRRTLDAVVAAYSKIPLRDLEPAVLQALRLGVYQLLYLDGVPAFAALSATVSSLGGGKSSKQRAYVNAVLRSIDRECRRVPLEKDRGGASPTKRLEVRARKACFFSRAVFPDPAVEPVRSLAVVHNHPPYLVERWLDRYGRERCVEMLEADNEPGPLFVRNNALRQTRDVLLERLHAEGLRAGPGSLENSVRVLDSVAELIRTRAFRDGACSVQDETAQRVAEWFPREGRRALDLCAAPGGKVCHLAEHTGDEWQIFACDRDEERLGRVRENVERLGLRSIRVLRYDPTEDAAWPDVLPPTFDFVLLDVPCSNTGVLRRKPEARERLDEARLGSLRKTQSALLDAAVPRVEVGAALLYSTCSLEPEENGSQVEAFLARRREFELVHERTTLPLPDQGDGGYAALLRRVR